MGLSGSRWLCTLKDFGHFRAVFQPCDSKETGWKPFLKDLTLHLGQQLGWRMELCHQEAPGQCPIFHPILLHMGLGQQLGSPFSSFLCFWLLPCFSILALNQGQESVASFNCIRCPVSSVTWGGAPGEKVTDYTDDDTEKQTGETPGDRKGLPNAPQLTYARVASLMSLSSINCLLSFPLFFSYNSYIHINDCFPSLGILLLLGLTREREKGLRYSLPSDSSSKPRRQFRCAKPAWALRARV